MSELAISAQDVTKTTSDRALYQQEYSTLGAYVNDVATKSFNGVSLFNGNTLNVTTDSEGATFSNLGVNLGSTTYTNATSGNISSVSGAQSAVTTTESGHQPARVGSREHRFQRRSAGLLQQPAQLVEQQPVGRQKSDHRRGRGDGKHQLRQGKHPRPIRHGDVGPGEFDAAVGPPPPVVSTDGALTGENSRTAPGAVRAWFSMTASHDRVQSNSPNATEEQIMATSTVTSIGSSTQQREQSGVQPGHYRAGFGHELVHHRDGAGQAERAPETQWQQPAEPPSPPKRPPIPPSLPI